MKPGVFIDLHVNTESFDLFDPTFGNNDALLLLPRLPDVPHHIHA